MLTATGLTSDLANVASKSLVSGAVVSSTLATLPSVETTSQINATPITTGIVGQQNFNTGIFVDPIIQPIWEPTPIWNGPVYFPFPSPTPESTGPLSAPTVSLPNQQAPISGGTGTGIGGIWVADPNSDDMTVTFSVQHGTLSVGGFGWPVNPLYANGPYVTQYGVTIAAAALRRSP